MMVTCAQLCAQVTFQLCDEVHLQFDAIISGGQGDWYFQGQWIGNSQTQYTLNDTGAYIFELIATSNSGCISSDKKIVEIVPCDSFYIYIPNAFTPNGDGLNDYFQPIGNIENWHLEVYDQVGGLIYSSSLPWEGNDIVDLYAFKLMWREKGAYKQYIGRVQLIK
jgi:hypothetical protein